MNDAPGKPLARRSLVLAGAMAAVGPRRSWAQSLPPLPAAGPSSAPFARLREAGAMTDHLMPGEEAERVTDIYDPRGWAVTGGAVQSAVHESFALS